MAARVQLPPIQDRNGRYQSDVTVIGVFDAETEEPVAVYNAREGGSVITFPSPGVTSGEEGELEAYAGANTVLVELDASDDSYDNPALVELVSWDAITDYIDLQPFSASTGVPGANVMDEAYGAVGDGSTDDWAAIQAAIEAAPDTGADTQPDEGWRVTLPPGIYRISQPIVINRRGTHLLGSGRSRSKAGSTLIRPDSGVKGIIVKHANGIGGSLGPNTNDPSDDTTGVHSILENFAIAPSAPYEIGDTNNHGIDVKATCCIKHVSVGDSSLNGFSANGININASVTTSNASQSLFMDIRVEGNAGSGFSVFGNDTSAMTFIACSSDLNGVNGFRESSFLGNTYIGCHTRDNGQIDANGVGYNCDSGSLFMGCYTESGQGENIMDHAGAMWFSAHGASTAPGDMPAVTGTVIEGSNGNLVASHGFQGMFARDRGEGLATWSPDNNTLFDVNNGDDDDLALEWDDTNKCWVFEVGAGGTDRRPLTFTTLVDDERPGVSRARFEGGLLIGTSTLTTRLHHGIAAPGSGTHIRGDIVFNREPSAGEPAGWICVTAGTPGTWGSFGTITVP